MKPALVFEKSITRDWSLIYAQIWNRVFTQEFRKQMKWGYTEVVFEGRDNTVRVYRAPVEHIEGMRNFIIKKLEKDPEWMVEQARQVEKQLRETLEIIKKNTAGITECSDDKLAHVFQKFIELNLRLGPRFIVILWFPIQMEAHARAGEFGKAIQAAVSARNKVEKLGPQVDAFARTVAGEVMRRKGLPAELSRFASIEDVLALLAGKKVREGAIAERRNYFIVTRNGISRQEIQSYLAENNWKLKEEKAYDASEIQGKPAYPGFAQGEAKIILNKQMFGKLEEGNVLVTTMTTPDFVPLLKKCAAFVTDEGGITCHAAIVARELKKSCVIGTKIATRALKDGDRVEIDAVVGMVRIIR